MAANTAQQDRVLTILEEKAGANAGAGHAGATVGAPTANPSKASNGWLSKVSDTAAKIANNGFVRGAAAFLNVALMVKSVIALVKWVNKHAHSFFKSLGRHAAEAWRKTSEFIKLALVNIKAALKKTWAVVVSTARKVISGVKTVAIAVVGFVKSVASSIWNFLKDVGNGIANIFRRETVLVVPVQQQATAAAAV